MASERPRRPHDLGGSVAGRISAQFLGMAADVRSVAPVHGEDRGPRGDDRAAVGVGGLRCRGKSEVTLAVGLDGVPQQPHRMGQAQTDDQLRVLPVAQHMRPPPCRLETRHRRLEMTARLGQTAGPVGGDSPM